MAFEKVGLLCGFISYPYSVDGRSLYEKVFSKFFNFHKEQWESCDPNRMEYNKDLYEPAGYRLFGSQGLMVLSLIDDYSFCTRHFNKNQIKTVLNKNGVSVEDSYWDYKSMVVTGITDREDCDLVLKSKNTFLKENNRLPYVGIIRLKFNPDILLGENRGVNSVRDVKECIIDLADELQVDSSQNVITIDCFDNDELTVIAFSDGLMYLYNLLGEIRGITNTMVAKRSKNRSLAYHNGECEKHVFSSALLYFGYDVRAKLDESSLESYRARCKIETKAGHRDSFYAFLEGIKKSRLDGGALAIDDLTKNITGGCGVIFSISVADIQRLEKLCESDPVFLRDVRKVKVSLIDASGTERVIRVFDVDNHEKHDNLSRNGGGYRISDQIVFSVRQQLKKLGVSKMVRDRIMALYELYNKSCLDALQRFYLEELKPSLENIELSLRDLTFDSKEDLSSIETALNAEVTSLENAFCDRLYFQKGIKTPLEYSGGIHQHLTALDFAYKRICRIFSPEEKNTSYVTITGADRASSCRMLFRLNINDIVFPELFVTTVWKEVANFHLKTLQKVSGEGLVGRDLDVNIRREFKEQIDRANTWHSLLHNADSFVNLKRSIDEIEEIPPFDGIAQMVKSKVNVVLLENFFKDYIVFHFAFMRDIRVMWHYYLKIMLQTTTCYYRLNHLNKYYLLQMLLRLFMVAKTSGDEEAVDFVNEQKNNPFDDQIRGEWQECFSKLYAISDAFFNVLERNGFKEMSDQYVNIMEQNVHELDAMSHDGGRVPLKEVLKNRAAVIQEMEKYYYDGRLIEITSFEKSPYCVGRYEFLICLLASYIDVLYGLDTQPNQKARIKVLPRNNEGDIHEIMFVKQHGESPVGPDIGMLNILADPTGGFFVPLSENRGKYFMLRSVFYKSLWDYRFRSKEL